jgi:hypothetical protein
MKKLTLLFISLFISLITFAGEVTEEQALQKAQQFMQGKKFKQKNLRRAAAIGGKSFYVFNAEQNGGFVIVSADDRTEPILGYADQGNIDVNKLPENTKKWLEGYEQQINALRLSSLPKVSSHRAIGGAIAPLLSCHWAQEPPFNGMCPLDGEMRCVTGCVATMMAQIMYYHKWPKTVVGPLESYTTDSQGILVPELPTTTFKWDKMKNIYHNEDTGEACDAVAELMRYCGQAVKMDYTAFVSGAGQLLLGKMKNTFGFSKAAQDITRSNFTTQDWEDIIYNELKEKRPVPYRGFVGVGHEFIVDGYDGQGLFHVNWGWGGLNDGYFALSILNPYESLLGSNGWCMGQGAIIGLEPDNGENSGLLRVYSRSSFVTSTYSRTGTEDFDINVNASFGSWAGKDITIDYRWVICKDGTIVKEFDPNTNVTIKNNEWLDKSDALSLGASLDNGDYELRQMYRMGSSDSWKYSDYYTDPNIILLTIDGTSLTLKYTFQLTDIYQINNVKFEGKRKTFRGMTAIVNWTNKGYNMENQFFLWDGVKDYPVGETSSYLSHNETGDVYINFPGPETAGKHTLKITSDYAGTNVLWTSEPLTFEESLPQNLTGQIDIANSEIVEDPKNPGWALTMVKGTTINATITLKNEGENAYNDLIRIELSIDSEDADNDELVVKDGERKEETFMKEISLGVGEETTLTAQFTNLVKGVRYILYAEHVYLLPNQVGWVVATNVWCEVDGGNYIPGDVNGDGLVNVTDIVATVNFIMEKPSDGFNKDAADLNGDGLVNVTDIVMMVSIIMNGGN